MSKRFPLLLLGILAVLPPLAASADDIDFEDLKRPGGQAEKSWTVRGASDGASDYIQRFGDWDTGRINNRRSAASSRSTSGSRKYQVEVHCRTSGLLHDRGVGGVFVVSANSSYEAEESIDAYAVCDEYGKNRKYLWYPDTVKVKEQ